MIARFAGAAVFMALVALAGSAQAQSTAALRQACLKANEFSDPHWVVQACSRAIPNGSLGTPQNVAYAYVQRGDFTIRGSADYVRAIADYDRALTIMPRFGLAFSQRGAAYLHQGDLARSIADLDRAVSLLRNPRDLAMAYHQRSQAQLALRDYGRAVADADRAAGYQPGDPKYQNGRCRTRAIANVELEKARAACDRALTLSPNSAEYLASRGLVSLRQQRWQEAWNDYAAASRSTSRPVAEYIYGRGIAALRLNQANDGQADVAAATQLDPSVASTFASYGVSP